MEMFLVLASGAFVLAGVIMVFKELYGPAPKDPRYRERLIVAAGLVVLGVVLFFTLAS